MNGLENIIERWLSQRDVENLRFKSVSTISTDTIEIYLDRVEGTPYICSNCGGWTFSKWSSEPYRRRIRSLDILKYRTFFVLYTYRIFCHNCKSICIEDIKITDKWGRYDKDFEQFVAKLCEITTIQDVAEILDLDWKRVKEIDKKYLSEKFKEPDFDNLYFIGIDEFSNKKGHNYFTSVINLEKRKVIWVGKGKTKETLDEFFKQLGNERAKQIKAIAMDMWEPYIASVKENAPHAKIIFDKFHIIKNYSKVIDQVRNEEYRKANEREKEVIKGTKYLLLSNKENLSEERKKHLEKLLRINRRINKVYILKDALREIWNSKTKEEIEKNLETWIRAARRSWIKPLKKFAEMLNHFSYGIIAFSEFPINTGIVEGFNNKIKVLKRMAYGFHDDDYFILKIKQACSGENSDKLINIYKLRSDNYFLNFQ